ncbi:hypothetical protein [Mycetohabitans sp. B46]|uniref:hypothetical protein n=1 Tax=Mycetohabitans sp. B46 TaxID=2772536 RepID=UPI00307F9D42
MLNSDRTLWVDMTAQVAILLGDASGGDVLTGWTVGGGRVAYLRASLTVAIGLVAASFVIFRLSPSSLIGLVLNVIMLDVGA